MAMPRGEAATLEAAIMKTRSDQRGYEQQLEQAVVQERRALAMVDAARALQRRCQRQIDEHADAISSLQDELGELIPQPRPAE